MRPTCRRKRRIPAEDPPPPRPVTLAGRHVRLEPLDPSHHDGLLAALADGEPWKLWYTSVPHPGGLAQEIAWRLARQAAGSMLPFTVFAEPAGTVAGMTTYCNIDSRYPRLEIGYTWYGASHRRTALNTEAKLLLLRHAFEALGALAVEFRTHVLNQPSRRAIERLGAKLDGILRCHMRLADGSLRDTCVYSITAAEWPAVRAHLAWQLERPR